MLAPSNRAVDLAAGRRALRRLTRDGEPLPELVALGPAIPVSRRSRMGVPLGVRANLVLALSGDRFDVVHAHDPGLPSLSYLALRHARGLTVATFHSPERLSYPPGKRQREKLLARVDALTATSDETLAAAQERFPGDFRRLPVGVDTRLFRPGPERQRFVLDWRADEPGRARAAMRALADLPDWELIVLRTRPLSGRPLRAARGPRPRPRAARARRGLARPRGNRSGRVRPGHGRLAEASTRGGRRRSAVRRPPGSRDAAAARRSRGRAARGGRCLAALPGARRRSDRPRRESVERLADILERDVYRAVVARKRRPAAVDPLADRPFVVCDLHMHTEHSHDCSVPVAALLDHAEARASAPSRSRTTTSSGARRRPSSWPADRAIRSSRARR